MKTVESQIYGQYVGLSSYVGTYTNLYLHLLCNVKPIREHLHETYQDRRIVFKFKSNRMSFLLKKFHLFHFYIIDEKEK